METSSSRPSSPGGERPSHCPSSSPSPSTGPPTKCVTPLSEPHSPNPPPPLVNPPISTLGSSSSHLCHTPIPEQSSRPPLPTAAPAAVVTSCPVKSLQPPHLLQDYSPYHSLQSHRSPYDLPTGPPSGNLLSASDSDRKRAEESSKSGSTPSSLTASSFTPQLVRLTLYVI